MWILFYLLIATGLALLALHLLRPALDPKAPAPRAPRRDRPAPIRTAAKALDPLVWDEPVTARPVLEGGALRTRMRDRYIAARFPGLVSGSGDLERVDHVIRTARLCFEEEKFDQAQELLHLAIEHSPDNEALRLAQLEFAFLRRSRERFVALASQFRAQLPQSTNWVEIARLGRAVAPDDPQFAASPGSHPHEHYGPWPDLPNWIQASWDLTAEVLAADFHRAMLRGPAAKRAAAIDKRLAIGA
jgi:hypothetical protein